VPASNRDGAGMRRHVRTSHANPPCSHAAESFVSFIPLFGRPTSGPAVGLALPKERQTRKPAKQQRPYGNAR
jgi:hypothetical protein